MGRVQGAMGINITVRKRIVIVVINGKSPSREVQGPEPLHLGGREHAISRRVHDIRGAAEVIVHGGVDQKHGEDATGRVSRI